MKKILLHIGTGKTGSTSIQRAMFTAERELKLGAISYPLVNNKVHHQEIVALYLPYSRLPRGLKGRYSADKQQYETVRKQYRDALFEKLIVADNVVLSAESLSMLSLSEVRMLYSDLAALGFSDYRVLMYVREPTSYYLSLVQQQLKASSKFSDPTSFKYNFREISQIWEEVYPGCVEVRPFAKGALQSGDVVCDFLSVAYRFFGMDLSLPLAADKENESVSAEAMVVLQKYRRLFYHEDDDVFKEDSNELLDVLQASLAEIEQTKPKLKKEVANYIAASHQKDVEFLIERYGVDLTRPREKCEALRDVEQILECVDEKLIEKLLFTVAKSILTTTN